MKRQICDGCRWYNGYYVRSNCGFNEQNHGFCRKNRRAGKFNETCENWTDNKERREKQRRITLEELYIMANKICEIAEILRQEHYGETDGSEIKTKKDVPKCPR